MAAEQKIDKQASGKLSVQSSLSTASINDEDDDAVGAAFLGIHRNLVKTAHEPKPPADYLDSSTDVVAAANKQQQSKKAPKPAIRIGPTISVGSGDDDDQKQDIQSKSDDKNKKKGDGTDNTENKNKKSDK